MFNTDFMINCFIGNSIIVITYRDNNMGIIDTISPNKDSVEFILLS